MTRKHYLAFALAFKITKDTFEEKSDIQALRIWETLRNRTVDIFEADNPRFDRQRFVNATEA